MYKLAPEMIRSYYKIMKNSLKDLGLKERVGLGFQGSSTN